MGQILLYSKLESRQSTRMVLEAEDVDTALLEIGIKAKLHCALLVRRQGYCSTRNWNQGKACWRSYQHNAEILLYSKLESRQSHERRQRDDLTILLYSKLESRQSGG